MFSAEKKYQIGITGPLASVDLMLAQALANLGFSCIVFRHESYGPTDTRKELGYYFNGENTFAVESFSSPKEFVEKASPCKVLVSFGLGFLAAIRYLYPLKFLKNFPEIMNISTGADMAEFIDSGSLKALLFKHHLNSSKFNTVLPFPHAIKNTLKYKLPNTAFIPFIFPINEDEEIAFPNNETLTFFHPTRFDWNETTAEKGRNTTKGNNRFIKAYAKAIKSGLKTKCHILERGVDLEPARKLISDLGIEDNFIWHQELSREDLFKMMRQSDVIVDQFDYGGFGGIAAEAMSIGKPLITYVNENSADLLYGNDKPPILNCWSESEIHEAIRKCEDRDFLRETAHLSKDWVVRNHHWKYCMEKFKFYYTLLTGEEIMDYGWKRTPETKSN